jgi:hypothetical protein
MQHAHVLAKILAAGLALAIGVAPAQTAPPVPATGAAPQKPATYALISAIGGELNFVRQRMQTGTSLGAYERKAVELPDRALDNAVLRGLDRSVARRDPGSQRVFLRLRPAELREVAPAEREALALRRLQEELAKLPQRAGWDKIVIVAPHYAIGGGNGMAERLHGIGVYVQGIDSGRDAFESAFSGYEAINPQTGRPNERATERFVAVYLQTRLWVLDAASLQVEHTDTWSFEQKFFDPDSTAVNVAASIPADLLAERLETFIEESSGRALARTVGTVSPGELRPADPPAAPTAR